MAKITKLDDLLKNNKAGESHIVDQVLSRTSNDIYKEAIPFPKLIQVETTNICNHGCEFCAYTSRPGVKSENFSDRTWFIPHRLMRNQTV